MKGKFGIAALLLSSITFAAPVSTPNPNLSDTPIISGGGNVSGGNTCRAYQTDGTAVLLSGGETLVFYASGGGVASCCDRRGNFIFSPASSGGYLSTKSNYSGTAYVRVKIGGCDSVVCIGGAIGLFARNTDSKGDFIAGAGAGGSGGVIYTFLSSCLSGHKYDFNAASGGGWKVGGTVRTCDSIWNGIDYCHVDCKNFPADGGNVYEPDNLWFTLWYHTFPFKGTPGFHGSDMDRGGASSISAFYNSYTRNYTSLGASFTITGGGYYGQTSPPALYVCQ